MQLPNDNRVILAVGAGLAILAAVVLALVFMGGGDATKTPDAEPAEPGGLSVDVADAPELQPTRELRCFVDGQFVGMATLADCAERNGLATDGLDVGLDASGNLAAVATASFAPPPTVPVEQDISDNAEPATTGDGADPQPAGVRPQRASGAPCLRYAGSEWRQLSGGMSLNECVQALYAGTCVGPGEAQYGRHGNLTLRLVPRRVEQSSDNTRFRVLAEQDRACQFPGLG
jgi:hypothetical protein